MPYLRFLCLLGLAHLLMACASLTPEFDPPKVSLESFKALPSDGGTPRFEMKLRIANPNKQSLDIAGISYSVDILDRELLSGVTNQVPLIEGYAEEVVTLEAGLQLFELIRLIAGLAGEEVSNLDYSFRAKIDFNGFVPTQRIEEAGTIDLSGAARSRGV
jgi:LEA14-like dessication related protein